MAFIAERYFSVADITGAYIAGVVISNTLCCDYIKEKMDTLSFLLLSPIFFASIGIDITINSTNSSMLIFTLMLIVIAILTKITGCGLSAKLCRYSNNESLQIGIGMISRGEVALIIANKGVALGLLNKKYFGPIIVVVIVTALITPILLKLAYNEKHTHTTA